MEDLLECLLRAYYALEYYNLQSAVFSLIDFRAWWYFLITKDASLELPISLEETVHFTYSSNIPTEDEIQYYFNVVTALFGKVAMMMMKQ